MKYEDYARALMVDYESCARAFMSTDAEFLSPISPLKEDPPMNDFDVVEVTVPLTWQEVDKIHAGGMSDIWLALLLKQAMPQEVFIAAGDKLDFTGGCDEGISQEVVRVVFDDDTDRVVAYVYRDPGRGLVTIERRDLEQRIRRGNVVLHKQEVVDDAD